MPVEMLDITGFKGLFLGEESLAPPNALTELSNGYISEAGAILSRRGIRASGEAVPGSGAILGLHLYVSSKGIVRTLAVRGGKLYASHGLFLDWVEVTGPSALDTIGPTRFVQSGDVAYFSGSRKGLFRYDGGSVFYAAGLAAPPSPPTINLLLYGLPLRDGGLTGPGQYRWRWTYVYGSLGESAPGAETPPYTATDDIVKIETPANVPVDVTALRLYRTDQDGAIYRRVMMENYAGQAVGTGKDGIVSQVPCVAGAPIWQYVFDGCPDADLEEEVVLDVGLPPAGNVLSVHKNRLFVSGSAEYPDRLWYSAINDDGLALFDVFEDGYFFDITTRHGEPITAHIVLGDGLAIFKADGVWILQGDGPDTFTLRKTEAPGCTAGSSIVKTPAGIAYLSGDQVKMFDGVAASTVSAGLGRLITDDANWTTLSAAVGETDGERYWLFWPSSGSLVNDTYVAMELRTGDWSMGDADASLALRWPTGRYAERLWIGSASDGRLRLCGKANNDDDGTVAFSAELRPIDCGAPRFYKEFRRLSIRGMMASALTVACDIDDGERTTTVVYPAVSETVAGVEVTDGREETRELRLPAGSIGKALRARIASTARTSQVQISGIGIGFRPKKRWRR